MNLITQLVAAISAIIASWKPTDSIQNDIADAITILATVEGVEPGLAFAQAGLQVMQKLDTEYTDLVNNQAALLGTVGATFNGQADKVMVLAIRESSPLAKQLLGV